MYDVWRSLASEVRVDTFLCLGWLHYYTCGMWRMLGHGQVSVLTVSEWKRTAQLEVATTLDRTLSEGWWVVKCSIKAQKYLTNKHMHPSYPLSRLFKRIGRTWAGFGALCVYASGWNSKDTLQQCSAYQRAVLTHQTFFNFTNFLPGQWDAILPVLHGKNVVAWIPTESLLCIHWCSRSVHFIGLLALAITLFHRGDASHIVITTVVWGNEAAATFSATHFSLTTVV
jgi:hypothetical protein